VGLFGRKKKRTLVIGLDGVPYTLLQKLTANGTMPNVARLNSLGHLSQMKVTLPEISAVSWPSFMTGTNPGTHGIYGFIDPKPESYDIRFPNFRDLKAPTFWDRIGEKKKRSVVINQPSTYPAREIPGVLVSGFVALSLKKAVSPLRILADLERLDYKIDVDTARARQDHDFLFEELDSTLKTRRAAALHFWENEDWDLMQIVVTGTDRLMHYLWVAIEDESHERHGQAMEYFRRIDDFIGEFYAKFESDSGRKDEGEGFFMLSDHGFCGIKQEVRVNVWLAGNGFLSFEKDEPSNIEDIAEGSKAFAVAPGRIFLNRSGRFPKGGVDDASARSIMDEIKSGLSGLTCDGDPVIQHVFERDEVYTGPETRNAPDLIPVGHHGYDLKDTVKEKELFGRTNLTGMHTWDDAFFWSLDAPPAGSPPDGGSELEITQLAGIIMETLA